MADRTCAIEACSRRLEYVTLGLCRRHYERLRTTGSVHLIPRPTTEERFWAKVLKTESCWLWTGAVGDHGYGNFVIVQPKTVGAHRFAYELLVGPIPEGFDIDHVRDNGCTSRACVKAIADEYGPTHLEAVTRAENLRRARDRVSAMVDDPLAGLAPRQRVLFLTEGGEHDQRIGSLR